MVRLPCHYSFSLLCAHLHSGPAPVAFHDGYTCLFDDHRYPHRLFILLPCLCMGQTDSPVPDGYHWPRTAEIHTLHRPVPDHQLLFDCSDPLQRCDAGRTEGVRGFPYNGCFSCLALMIRIAKSQFFPSLYVFCKAAVRITPVLCCRTGTKKPPTWGGWVITRQYSAI